MPAATTDMMSLASSTRPNGWAGVTAFGGVDVLERIFLLVGLRRGQECLGACPRFSIGETQGEMLSGSHSGSGPSGEDLLWTGHRCPCRLRRCLVWLALRLVCRALRLVCRALCWVWSAARWVWFAAAKPQVLLVRGRCAPHQIRCDPHQTGDGHTEQGMGTPNRGRVAPNGTGPQTGCAHGSYAAGRASSMVRLPFSTRAPTVPPMAAARRATMARPRPLPWPERAVSAL